MARARYKCIAEQRTQFGGLTRLDGRCGVELDPNETCVLAEDPKHPLLVKVEDSQVVKTPATKPKSPVTPADQ